MKAVCFIEPEIVQVRDVPEPAIESPRDAIVKVECAGLCGSDLHLFHGRESGADVGTIMGHEFVGTVVAVGDEVHRLQVGDRVCSPFTTNCGSCFFCQSGLTSRCVDGQLFGWRANEPGLHSGLHGGQAEFVRVALADSTLLKVPDSASDQLALLLGDNLSTGFFCAEMAGFSLDGSSTPPETVVVIGCGTVGLLAIFAAKFLGAKQIVAIDLVADRLRVAERFGARVATNEGELRSLIDEMTDGRGADAVMELVGLPAAQKLAMRTLRQGGTMAVVGCHCTPNFAFTPMEAYDKNLVFKNGRCPARYYMDQLADRVCESQFQQLQSLITHEFAIKDGVAAYDTFSNRKDGCIKAMFRF